MRGILVLELRGGGREQGWLQPFAGGELWSDVAIAPGAVPAARPEVAPLPAEAGEPRVVYDGPGLVGGRLQRIRSLVEPTGVRRVEHEDGETYRVSATGGRVERLVASAAEALGPHSLEQALGGPLALALAVRGAHLLHASALRGRRGVVALLADSGGGKSTLAAAAARWPELGLARLADDQLAVRLGVRPAALPHFPQLKLAGHEAYPAAAAAELPLVMVVELERRSGPAPGPALERLGTARTAAALVRATVATRLFDEGLLQAHFAGCASSAAALDVCALRYPDGLDRLRDPLGLLADVLQG